MKKAAVIGNPIQHSKSPFIHNFWLKKFNIEGSYEAIRAENNGDFEKIVLKLIEDGYMGFNVTIPFKGLAHEMCDEHLDIGYVSHYPSDLGAANTIKIKDGKLIGYNTDFFGFYQDQKITMRNDKKNVIILGAGGAARSIAFGLASMKKYCWDSNPTLTILNRNQDRAKSLIDDIYKSNITSKKMNKDLTLLSGPLEDIYERIKGCNLLINTTPIGMNDKGVNFPFDIREVLYGANELLGEPAVYDIVYNPLKTKLLEEADKMNLVYKNGMGMLIWQAAPAFNLFFLENDIDNFEEQHLEQYEVFFGELWNDLFNNVEYND